METTQHRQPRGRPIGGQFAAKANPEADLELDAGPERPEAVTQVPSGEAVPKVLLGELEKTERIKAMHAEIENAITTMSDHEGWQRFLDSAAQFHRYSFGNTMLVLMQRKDATRVAGFNDWKNKHNRTVKKGEKAIWILAPIVKKEHNADSPDAPETSRAVGFRSVPVFDVSQTEGEPLPENPGMAVDDLGPGEAPAGMVDDLTATLAAHGFRVERGDTGDAKGFTRFADKLVVISDKVNERQAAKTLAHEAAHVVLGHGDRIGEYHTGGRPDMEVEAESVAYVVSKHWGLADASDYSFGYIDHWAHGDPTKVKKTAEAVIRASRALIPDQLDTVAGAA